MISISLSIVKHATTKTQSQVTTFNMPNCWIHEWILEKVNIRWNPKYTNRQNNTEWMEFCRQAFGFVPQEPLHKDYPALVKQIQAYLTRVQIDDKEFDRFMTFFRLYQESLKVYGFDFAEEMLRTMRKPCDNKEYPVYVFIYILQLAMERTLIPTNPKRKFEL